VNVPNWISLPALAALLAIAIGAPGCSAPDVAAQRRAGAGATAPDGNDDADPGTEGDATNPKPGEPRGGDGPLGVVVIDVQTVFFDTATARNPKNTAGRMANTAKVFQLAATKQLPVFITYEDSKTGDHALPSSLAAAVPANAQHLIKTTFAATGQPQFMPAIMASGARRLVVVGAETDVCVMQSILGLRRAGYEVIAVVEGLFTEEINTAPAFRRMRQAGVVQITMQEAEALLTSGGRSPTPPAVGPPVIVRPLETGILLHDVQGLSAPDTNAGAKTVRLRELLLISEWFRMPLFAADPAATTAALPADLRALITRPIAPLSQRPSQVKQLAIAGGRTAIAAVAAGLAGKVDVFLVEDALVGAGDLEPLYVNGAVPTTYKTLYYEMIQSVSEAQWPSQQWVTDGARYYDLTKAPEELPPLKVP
jgi:nicotinamidase-related amidase